MSDAAELPQIVLCVPGDWEDRTQFLDRLIHGSAGDYLFLGRLLMHVPTRHVFELEFEPRDERMAQAFAAAGPHWRDSGDMARIGSHRSVVYLLGHGGSETNVHALMAAGRALLDAGGLGVKVESSGIAHAPAAWRAFCTHTEPLDAYRAFVVVVSGRDEAYTCGMHTFGMHDVQVVDDDAACAADVAGTFSRYLLLEHPDIKDGQTFACDADAPVFRIASGSGVDYEPDSLFSNPYGTWRLTRY